MSGRALLRPLGALAPYLTLLLLFLLLAAALPAFRTADNLWNQARRAALYAIPAVGMTFVIVLGMIDLSVGSMIALCGLAAAAAVRRLPGDPSLAAGIAAGLLCGLGCGALNGLLATRLRIPSFLATLGTLGIYRGLAQYSTGGTAISAPRLRALDGAFLGLPLVLLAALLVAGGAALLLHRMRFGRHTYAIGGNPRAAVLCGVPADRHVVAVYALAGLSWGLTALFFASLGGSGDPNEAEGFELDVIASVVIGGGSLSGGAGSVAGAVAGTSTIVLLRNGCVLGNVDPLAQKILIGAVLILAVAFDALRRRRAGG
ncbi:MAG TPA: ABC transporter permease [Planctomycetota bacterium]|jgi:ribose/xylose/arabinose/galactoside ABC-type transport system permease subunit|nr:ABC transporter permease [Planctomycetota bacterium]